MYQKPEADETLAPSKEASFMDRMYMKIEAICVEADKNPSLLFQEAGKYFETQVSTAGATMRKVCSELIRDLLPAEDECKHVDKCQCRCEASKKKAAVKQEDSQTQAETGGVSQGGDAQLHQTRGPEIEAPEIEELAETQAQTTSSGSQAEESDTVVEAGDQVAQWYITDEYKKSSGIVENWDSSATAVTNPKEESDSEWEIL
ncbi:hypothetical protein SELMODRAFT_445872 [Selaginella moellendorffii]|uniref:Uncharacterized protein n=1 Tax=Selaginella moellendorffii TaxID=88036 RepID=D8SLZ1_SELML|nr:uncharacterized protein LOC9644386 [Selaginella moellendorffii]EFJ14513.1 hypothetical protein SELMODRAFT_445872 [Selaginella moellendorffii]|eukprot:XP_002984463.1 uncharacterized protein LOC9644386 [Selaginella moellendorffii]